MIQLDLSDAKRITGDVVAEAGEDYVYPYASCVYAVNAYDSMPMKKDLGGDCVYFRKAQTLCLIGKVLQRTGIPTDVLASHSLRGDVHDAAAILRRREYLDITEAAVAWLNIVQQHQDKGVPWGEAVRLADVEYGNPSS